ncbi:MAG TPA: preprotein translocase subunit YajC [Oscillospiraceae bacterium]|nr:preprotein translocase subunit YajC [Oscillospiraceae bacterium]HPF56808.1 preprotein translocase subunit YajC [Clostridiales bacterium]HPK34178.1 preprotein translocase subunit YajC [Oscillospiraceae bacterium]HPR74919.1 preprotein translocase subunit YajC [Oscillospiraceae bacterium]
MNAFLLLIGRLLDAAGTSAEVLTTAAPTDTSVVDSAVSTASDSNSLLGGGGIWSTVILFGVLILAMYFLMIRPQKKRDKEQKMMRDALAVGDEIVTIGGIAGTVVSVREDSIVIETGSDRDKMKIMKWAIQTITAMRKSEEE